MRMRTHDAPTSSTENFSSSNACCVASDRARCVSDTVLAVAVIASTWAFWARMTASDPAWVAAIAVTDAARCASADALYASCFSRSPWRAA